LDIDPVSSLRQSFGAAPNWSVDQGHGGFDEAGPVEARSIVLR
jgi:hypothetical protein